MSAEFPAEYVRADAECDVPGCGKKVEAGRTLTFFGQDRNHLSILIRLCADHINAPVAELAKLLPALPPLDGSPYLDLGATVAAIGKEEED
jgi:hypothetical protein